MIDQLSGINDYEVESITEEVEFARNCDTSEPRPRLAMAGLPSVLFSRGFAIVILNSRQQTEPSIAGVVEGKNGTRGTAIARRKYVLGDFVVREDYELLVVTEQTRGRKSAKIVKLPDVLYLPFRQ